MQLDIFPQRYIPIYELIPGMPTLWLDVPLYFFNTSTVSIQIRTAIAARFGALHSDVLDIGASAHLDIASLDMLHDLADELRAAQGERWKGVYDNPAYHPRTVG